MNVLKSTTNLISGFSLPEDISILFSSTKSLTPSFNSTIADMCSDDSSFHNIHQNPDKCNCKFFCQSEINANSSTKYQKSKHGPINKNTVNKNFHLTEPLDRLQIKHYPGSNKAVQYNNRNTSNTEKKNFQIVDSKLPSESSREGSTNVIQNKENDLSYNKNGDKCLVGNYSESKNEEVDNFKFLNKINKKSKKWSCSFKIYISCGLCLFGYILVWISTSIFSGCWFYLVYASSNICSKVLHIRIIWHPLYIVLFSVIGFTFINIIPILNSPCGKTCNIVILVILILQLITWILLFTIIFCILIDIQVNVQHSKVFCGFMKLWLNFSNTSINKDFITPVFQYTLVICITCTFINILAIIFVIIGASMNYQRMKIQFSHNPKLKKVQMNLQNRNSNVY